MELYYYAWIYIDDATTLHTAVGLWNHMRFH